MVRDPSGKPLQHWCDQGLAFMLQVGADGDEESDECSKNEKKKNGVQDLNCSKEDGYVLCSLEDFEAFRYERCDLIESFVDLFGIRQAHNDACAKIS